MKRCLAFLIIGAVSAGICGSVSGQEKTAKRHGATIGVFRDGGSLPIHIPALGDKPAREIVVDHGSQTKTNGEIFLLENFSPDKPPLSPSEADVFLKQLEAVLVAHYGAEKLLEIMLNPIELNVHLTEKEFGDKLSDVEFTERFDARCLMQEIMTYRSRHATVVRQAEK